MKAARSVCALAGPAVWTAGLLVSSAGFAAAATGQAPYVRPAVCTAPPAPEGKKKTFPEGRAKPSSFAPQPRPPHRAYGTPIQPPILRKRHKKGARVTGNQAPATHSTKPDEAPK